MCGRMVLTRSAAEIAAFFELETEFELVPSYNIPPGGPIAAIRESGEAGRTLCLLRWGLVPAWAKDAKIGQRMINARSETAAERPSFRNALRRRRCVVPADAFYEWSAGRGEARQPHVFRSPDGSPLAIAGLWESWRDKKAGLALESCTLLTRQADSIVGPVHHRMPLLLARADFEAWLDPMLVQGKRIEELLNGSSGQPLEGFPVSRWVNDPRHDEPRCIEPV